MKHTRVMKALLASALMVVVAGSAIGALALSIDGTYKYAWGENVGWLNWGTSQGAVSVPETTGELTGYVWGENIGWISLNCSNTDTCVGGAGPLPHVDFKVVRGAGGDLTGYAWGENVGWISFSCANTDTCTGGAGPLPHVDYGVTISGTGEFAGYAYGENIGWIVTNCSTTASCGTVDYKVLAATPPPGGGGGGGSYISPAPTPLPPGIVIDNDALTTTSRFVRLDLLSPFGGQTSGMRLVNGEEFTPQDRELLPTIVQEQPRNREQYFFPEPTYFPQSPPQEQPPLQIVTDVASTSFPALTSGTEQSFRTFILNWDLCRGAASCEPGNYTVYVQYAKPATVMLTSGTHAALGDILSGAYYDVIAYLGTTPTPTPTATATPAATATPPVVAPPAPPPSFTPPAGPPGVLPPPGGPPGGGIVNLIDSISAWLFSNIGDALGGLCFASGIQFGACTTTAAGTAAFALSLLAILIQQEFFAGWFWLLQIVGLKRKTNIWGVLYDVKTKRPIPLVKVELLGEDGRVLETRFADRDGRYGFLTSPLTMHQSEIRVAIRASKPGYTFPSASLNVATDFIVYDHLYYGGILTLRTDTLLNFNIPMTPVAEGRLRFSGMGLGLVGPFGDRLLNLAFYLGLVLCPLNYYLQPTRQHLFILILFLAVNAYRLFLLYRPYGLTKDSTTGRVLPYALVTLNDLTGTRQGFAVSDEFGRYILSGQGGTGYDLITYTPANILPQRSKTTRVSRLSRRGWATLTLTV